MVFLVEFITSPEKRTEFEIRIKKQVCIKLAGKFTNFLNLRTTQKLWGEIGWYRCNG